MIYYVGYMPCSSDLYHHGIKGQQWGVRRFQNPDGTLTPEGKARYGTVANMKAQVAKENAADSLNSSRRKAFLKTINPVNLVSKNKRQEAKEARKASKQEYEKYKKAEKEADKTERTWMKEKYEDEIAKGAELYVNNYDPDEDDENLEELEREVEYRNYMRSGSNSANDFMEALADRKMLEAEREANKYRKNVYSIYTEWGIDPDD